MVILRMQIGQQVRYVEGMSPLDAIREAESQGIPEHLIREGLLFSSGYRTWCWMYAQAPAPVVTVSVGY